MTTRIVLAVVSLLIVACGADEAAEVRIPAGVFVAGCNMELGKIDVGCDRAVRRPRQEVHLPEFWIDRNLVTRSRYERCVTAGHCTPGQRSERGPSLAYVTHDQANEYCRWRGQRLPTGDEFEKAARGTDGRIHPWGDGRHPTCNAGSPPCWRVRSVFGVAAVARAAQWVAERNEGFPLGMIRGGVEPFAVMNAAEHSKTMLRAAFFRCARSSPPPSPSS